MMLIVILIIILASDFIIHRNKLYFSIFTQQFFGEKSDLDPSFGSNHLRRLEITLGFEKKRENNMKKFCSKIVSCCFESRELFY